MRGKRYNGEKATGFKGNQHTDPASYQNDKKQTHERLAEEYKVSPATITRDGNYAAAVDSLAAVGIEPQAVIAHASKVDVIELAKVLNKPEPVIESQRAMVGARLKSLFEEQAKKRQVEAAKIGGSKTEDDYQRSSVTNVEKKVVQNSAPSSDSGKSRDKAAELVNVSHLSRVC